MSIENRKNVVLSIYRQLIYYSKLIIDKNDSRQKVELIKSQFRKNKDIQDSKKIDELLVDSQKKLSFLKISTPRQYGKSYRLSGTYKFQDGKWIEGSETQKGKKRYNDHGIDIMDWNRHQHLLKRMNFMNR
ncbi:LYR motif-containing protein [Tieghemostelium lacteum]|uniref:LYR motif-containing protein n=1 Tax=Tieghemostelium lacteum TaxID=361077 RepID=A0A152A5R9_TIELA|nr:LYR motif-containing protein [Tieghemostelium lacteum]|eukprot:KYR01568.1 LYR motif-containing protein [Tieghemostelium lacteum]